MLQLEGAPIEALESWQARKRSLGFELHPLLAIGCAYIVPKTQQAGGSGVKPEIQETTIYPAEFPQLLFDDEYGQIVKESHSIFSGLVKFCQHGEMDDEDDMMSNQDSLARFVGLYIDLLVHAISKTYTRNGDFIDAVHVAQTVYAIYFLAQQSQSNVAHYLSDIVNRVDPRPSLDDTRSIMTTEIPCQSSLFWPYVYKLLIRGMIAQTSSSFRRSGIVSVDPTANHVLDQVLRLLESDVRPQNNAAYRTWRTAVIETRDKLCGDITDASIRQGFVTLLNILAGDRDVLVGICESWFEAVSALLFFHDSSTSRISEYYAMAVDIYPVDETLYVEAGCAAAISGNLAKVFVILESLDLGVAAHIADFCERAGLLDEYMELSPNQQQNMRDWLIFEYGIRCMINITTWAFGVDYLKQSQEDEQAITVITSTIPHLPLIGQESVDSILKVCYDLELIKEAQEVTKAWSKKLISQGRPGDAFIALEKAGMEADVRLLSWQIFERLLLQGHGDESIIQGLGIFSISPIQEYPATSTCISPLMVLLKAIEEKKIEKRIELIIKLLQFSYLPAKYLGILIADLLTLVDLYGVVFSHEQLMIIVNCLLKFEDSKSNLKEGLKLMLRAQDIIRQEEEEEELRGSTISAWRSSKNTPKVIIKQCHIILAREIAKSYVN